MGVATGSATVSTNFAVPSSIDQGPSELCVVANGISSPCCPLTTWKFRFPWPHYEIWQRLIGSLADGPLWGLGPHGPVPIDPWGPKYAKDVQEAQDRILEGFRELQNVGMKLFEERLRRAKERPLAPDEASEEESEGKEQRESPRRRPLSE